jgi:hypothetical protein
MEKRRFSGQSQSETERGAIRYTPEGFEALSNEELAALGYALEELGDCPHRSRFAVCRACNGEGAAHRARHVLLHKHLDELLADFIRHTRKRPSETTMLEFLEWSAGQTKKNVPPDEA